MIYICLRRTTEWDNETVFLEQLKDNFRPKVEVWNSLFTIPYHIFRHRIKKIAQLNLSKVENARCTTIDRVPEGGLVVPVDDDDWISPELGNVLEAESEADKAGYYWERSFLGVAARSHCEDHSIPALYACSTDADCVDVFDQQLCSRQE